MKEESEIRVEYARQGDDGHFLALGSAALPDIAIDYTGIPETQRAGTATRLLCAAALYCFASTLGTALAARGATIRSLVGRATASKGRDDYYKSKVTRISVELEVGVDEADVPILEKCQKIMRDGCFITYSLGEGVEMDHVIRRMEAD